MLCLWTIWWSWGMSIPSKIAKFYIYQAIILDFSKFLWIIWWNRFSTLTIIVGFFFLILEIEHDYLIIHDHLGSLLLWIICKWTFNLFNYYSIICQLLWLIMHMIIVWTYYKQYIIMWFLIWSVVDYLQNSLITIFIACFVVYLIFIWYFIVTIHTQNLWFSYLNWKLIITFFFLYYFWVFFCIMWWNFCYLHVWKC